MSSEDDAPKKQRASWVSTLIGIIIGLSLGLTVGAAMTFWRVFEAHQVLEATLAEHVVAREAKDAEMETLRAEMAAVQSTMSGMDARISVCRAVAELDARNFGSAQSELESARTALGNAPEDVQAAARSLAEVDLRAAVDAGNQRQTMLSAGRQMDAAIRD